MFKAISEQSYCMKIPVYIQETLSKFSKVKREMERAYNCQVANKDVAEKMNIEPEKIDTFYPHIQQLYQLKEVLTLKTEAN